MRAYVKERRKLKEPCLLIIFLFLRRCFWGGWVCKHISGRGLPHHFVGTIVLNSVYVFYPLTE